jgi:dCMP deaminase
MERCRLTRQEYLTEQVKLAARRGTCLRAQVGALLVRDGRIISTGYNGSPPGEPHCLDVGCQMEDGHCVRTTHAETNVIAFAARNGIPTDGCDMWVYGWDGGVCHRCKKVALSAGIRNIIVVPLEKPFTSCESFI